MKTKFLLCLLAVSILTVTQSSQAQQPLGGVFGGAGGQVYEPGTFTPVASELRTALPGRIWVEANLADQGLGYQGSYATLGAKTRLFEDFFDGRWLFEARAHHSLNGGGFFGNFGIERVFSVDAAGATVSMGVWGDYDSDQQGDFAHSFAQVGVTGKIKTRRWDLIGNAYFPEGTTTYTQGDPTGANTFFGNSIIVLPGIDSALKGFDVTMRFRPRQLAFVNGTLEVGGYGYDSDVVEFFGGGRIRLGMQVLQGMVVNTEVNYDDRFDLTGVVSLGWTYGINARGNEYDAIGRDLEQTSRNDHIVRFQQDVVLAIDPDTGLAYNVFHVDNTADAGVADGTFERPFTTLAEAEAASGENDIIFVDEGDGTGRGMRDGIALRNNQQLLGDGVEHIIPIQDGQFFRLSNDVDGIRPTISGSNNGNAVTLANNNVVAGFNIDGSEGVGNMSHGIFGDGNLRGSTITGGVIRDNVITNAVLDGVHVENVGGDWTFADNDINTNAFDGIRIIDACDPNSVFVFDTNDVSTNGQDGISIENYDAASLTFLSNVTNNNGGDGIRLVNFKNTNGTGLDLTIAGGTAIGNNGFGLNIIGGDGNLRILNSSFTNNLAGGMQITDWTNTDPNSVTFIGTTGTGTSSFSNNATGVGIRVLLNSGTQRLVINDTLLDGNTYGLEAIADGVGTNLLTTFEDNTGVTNNAVDGLRFGSTNGANSTVVIRNTLAGLGQMQITGNGGNGISFFGGDNSGNISTIQATIDSVNLAGNSTGLATNLVGDGALQLNMTNSNVDGNGNGLIFNMDLNETQIVNNLNFSNINMLDNAFNGIVGNIAAGTFLNFSLVDSVLENTTGIDAAGDNNTTRVGGFGTGVLFNIAGDDALTNPQIDTRVQMSIVGSSINRFLADGVNVSTTGDARLVSRFAGNTLLQNGYGPADGTGTGGPSLPVFNGIVLTSADTSQINTRIENNTISNTSERGIVMTTQNQSTINAIWVGNDLNNNDVTTDGAVIAQGVSDFDVTNAAGSQICLAMSNNFFGPFNITNLGAGVDFNLELDGFTNNFGPASGFLNGQFNFPTFGTICEGRIATEEAAFEAAGFPPIQ